MFCFFLSLSLEHWLKVFRSFMDMMRENLISRQSSGKRSGIYRRETRKFFGSKTDMVPVFGIPWYRQEMRNDVKRLMVHYSALDRVPPRFTKPSCISAPRHLQMSLWRVWTVGIDMLLTCYHCYHVALIIQYYRRKFRSETSDNMDSWKAEVRRVRRNKIRRKKMQMREKVGKSRFTVFFQWFGAPEGRKVGSLKRRVRSQLARWEMKKCTPLWREAHFQVKMYKAHQLRTTFGSWDVETVHAVVARSTFPSQNVQNTPASDHFWKLRCRKSARRCGAKHISKSKCTKHTSFGPLLEVEMSKKCTPLWREAHFEVKMYKAHHARTTFGSWDVEKVHAVVARSTFRSQNVQNTPCSDHFWRFRCRKSVEKVHAVVARSTFRSQKCKKLWVLSLFWREDVEKVDTA